VTGQPKAFVLIPFDDAFTAVWKKLLKPDLEAAGYIAERADSRLDQQNVLRDIVRGIAEADLIVADLTSLNPNVFYELGVAHGLEIPTVLISQVVEEVPFDLRSYRVQEYSVHFDKVDEFREKLREIGNKHREGKVEFGSPVKDFLGASGSRRPGSPRPKTPASSGAVVTPEEAEPSEEAEAGFLDFLVGSEEASQRLTDVFQRIGEATEAVGNQVSKRTEKLEHIQASGRPDAPKLMHITVRQAANDLNTYADALEEELPELEAAAERMVQGFSSYVDWFAKNAADAEDRAQIEELQESFGEMLGTARETVGILRDYEQNLQTLEGVSRPLTAASRRVVSDVSRITTVLEEFEAFGVRAVSLIEEAMATASLPERE
jgi:hypothetical protein